MGLALEEFARWADPRGSKLLVLLVDNAGWHVAKRLAVPANVRPHFLPPCTPELQPVGPFGALVREAVALRVPLRPVPADLGAQLGLGRDLLLRSLAFQACFLSATAVTARFGAASVAAHQVVLQLWTFMSTVLDSLAMVTREGLLARPLPVCQHPGT